MTKIRKIKKKDHDKLSLKQELSGVLDRNRNWLNKFIVESKQEFQFLGLTPEEYKKQLEPLEKLQKIENEIKEVSNAIRCT